MKKSTYTARNQENNPALTWRSHSGGNSDGGSQCAATSLDKKRNALFCGIICCLLAGVTSMSQQQLVFAPSGIVELGAVGNSGSGARYLSINGEQHISKCKSHSNGVWVCFNEFFAARIASKIGLPVPPFRVIPFRGSLPSPEMWFCSKRINPGGNPDAVSFARLRNGDSLGGIAVLDLWLCNIDRKNPNLFVERFQDGTEMLFVIDHGHILLTSGNIARLRSAEFCDGKRIFSGCPDLVASIKNVNEFASWLGAIKLLSEQEIEGWAEGSPSEWVPDGKELKDLMQFVLERRDRLQSILEANFGLFPNLKRGVA